MLAVIPVADAVVNVVWPDTVRVVAVVVAKVEVPVTERVPLEAKDEVAVRVPKVPDPPVNEEMTPVRALKVVAKRFVEVALVRTASVAVKLEMTAVTALKSVAKRLDEVAFWLVKLVIVPFVP